MMSQILSEVRSWEPFRIDALGIITLIGASELDSPIGQLFSPIGTIDFLPLLAPFIISNNSFMKPIPGVTLYNITDGIVATDVSGWVARWLQNRNLTWNSTTLIISACPSMETRTRIGDSRTRHARNRASQLLMRAFNSAKARAPSVAIGAAVMIPVVMMPIFQEDWFGLANAAALLMTIVTRALAVSLNRRAIARGVAEALQGSSHRAREMVKVAITLPGGRFVTVHCQRGILKGTILTAPRPQPWLYKFVLGLSWIALGCHVVSLGMATLVNQIICILALVGSTSIYVSLAQWSRRKTDGGALYRLGHGSGGMLWRLSEGGEDGRSFAYARLALSDEEEQTMCNWHLFPARSNHGWWEQYYGRKVQVFKRLGA